MHTPAHQHLLPLPLLSLSPFVSLRYSQVKQVDVAIAGGRAGLARRAQSYGDGGVRAAELVVVLVCLCLCSPHLYTYQSTFNICYEHIQQ